MEKYLESLEIDLNFVVQLYQETCRKKWFSNFNSDASTLNLDTLIHIESVEMTLEK